jgi:hypothetical protein
MQDRMELWKVNYFLPRREKESVGRYYITKSATIADLRESIGRACMILPEENNLIHITKAEYLGVVDNAPAEHIANIILNSLTIQEAK